MLINSSTLALIKEREGLVLKAYPDPGSKNGKPVTIGYGTTKINGEDIPLGTTITATQAEAYLEADLEEFAKKVKALVKVTLNSNQFGALVSLAYNIGIRAFANSTLLRVLNEGNFDRVPEQFMRWVYNDEVFMKGLKIRREKEVVLWNKEPEDGDETPVSKTRSLLEIIISILRKLFK